jgi:hypothetical protein
MTQQPDPVPAPDARLTAAATRLRTLLANPELTAGPWLSLDHGDRLIRNQPGDEDRAPIYVVNEPISNGANADYIAAVHPGVGTLVAQLLEERALVARHAPGAGGTATDRVALVLADAILTTGGGAELAEAPRTPCSFPPCDTGPGEPCTRHEREEAHAEGNHELCGPECVTAYVLTRGEPGNGGEQA